jgi:hypothetical protein
MLCCVALLRTDFLEELSPSIIVVTRIGELGMLAITSNRRTLLVTANVPSSQILVTPMMEALSSSEKSVLKEPHGITSQKTPFFIVTAIKTSNLTLFKESIQTYWNKKEKIYIFSYTFAINLSISELVSSCG